MAGNPPKGQKTLWKRRNCSFRAISPISTVNFKDLYCIHGEIKASFGKCEKRLGNNGKLHWLLQYNGNNLNNIQNNQPNKTDRLQDRYLNINIGAVL